MPKIDMNAYESATETSGSGGSRPTFTAGAYVLRIQAVRTAWETRNGLQRAEDRKCVRIVFDVAEGDCAYMMSDDDFYAGEDNDFKHSCWLSWKNMGFLKRIMRVLAESNPGFDPMAAFQADRWDLFVGKLFGAVVDGEVDTNDRGYDRWRNLSVGEWCTVADIRSGNHREPRIQDNRTAQAPASYGASDPYSADVPF